MVRQSEHSWLDQFCLPDNLAPLSLEMLHTQKDAAAKALRSKTPEQVAAEYKEYLHQICRSQILWLTRLVPDIEPILRDVAANMNRGGSNADHR